MNSKRIVSLRFTLLLALAGLSFGALHIFAGHPLWPPPPHSPDYRQANMFFLRFQDAVAANRWDEALSFCSDRIRVGAAEHHDPAAFFKETLPIENLLSQDFGCWRCGSNSYGLFVPLTPPGATPVIQWHWAIYFTNNAWVVDYPPINLTDYITRKKTSLQAREDKIMGIRQSLEPKLKGIKTHLTALSERFVIGSPMLFRVEIINFGAAPVSYANSGVAYHPLTVLNATHQAVPSQEEPGQIMEIKADLAPGASALLADKIDIARNHTITKPGKYFVQFSGAGLEIGESVPPQNPDAFAEETGLWPLDFVSTSASFPSEILEIEVITDAGTNKK